MHRVPGEHVCQFLRMAERRAVTGGDLVWSDAKTFGDHPAHELRREKTILSTQEELGRHVRPRAHRPVTGARRPA